MNFIHLLYLDDIMYMISSVLIVPVVVLLVLFVLYALWCIGSIVVEALTERRNFRAEMPVFLAALAAATTNDIPLTIADSGLLNRQKASLLTLWDYRCLPPDTYVALAKRLLADEDLRYKRILGRTDTASKIAPMIGLMGTLIPLGPGIVALGQGDTTTLSASLGVAFNTTVCGLMTAVVALVVSKIRRSWYENYLRSSEGASVAVLEIVEGMRTRGGVDIDEPGSARADMGFAPDERRNQAVESVIERQRTGDEPATSEAGVEGEDNGVDR